MEHLERFEKLLKTYEYRSLPHEEKTWVCQFVSSEEEYESLRRTTLEMEKHFTPLSLSPAPGQLHSLRQHWKATHSVAQSGIRTIWSVPAYAAVLALTLVAGISWYAGLQTGARPVYRERLVTRTDTVTILSRPDTIVVERVIYRDIPALVPVTVSNKEEKKDTQMKGVNMKEKEELEKLMVTGSF
ncbi:MAG: hypothetical protein JST14_12235 [Bacteroidetes bacterium]|nr:hypothetical protein [Bacteroidota bacterium]